MKKVYLAISLLLLMNVVIAQSRYWVGPSGGQWSSAANWSATSGGTSGASYPVAANDVIFDNGFSGTVDMDVLSSTTFSVNSLLITGNSTVTLQRTQTGGGTRVFQLMSTGTSTKGLQINSGSTLVIDANDNTTGTLNVDLALTGSAGVTGEIAGNLYFKGSGVAGTGSAQLDLQDDATHYAALVVKSGGLIKYFVNSGNTSPGSGNYLTMEAGSIYELNKNGGSFPPGNWDANSLVRMTGTTSTISPTFNGTVYGNLEWNSPGQSTSYVFNKDLTFNNVDFVSTNNQPVRIKSGASAGVLTLTINGNLTVGATTRLELTGNTTTTGNGGRISLKGNLINSGIITTTGMAGTVNEFEMSGVVNQQITNTGTFAGTLITFIQNNTGGSTLLTPLSLPNNLVLTSGKIFTTSTNLLTMIDNATYTGGSSISFVEGPMKKIGDENFTFPIGMGSIYAPAGITHVSGTTAATDAFTAEYKRTNPQGVYGKVYAAGIDHISFVEYWDITKNAGNVSLVKNVQLTATALSFAKVLASTFVSHFSGGQWTKEPSSSTVTGSSGGFELGTVITTAGISTFSPFTLATDLSFTNNPLPINLVKFSGEKIAATQAGLSWELATACSPKAIFEIEKSTDGRTFSTLATIAGNELNRFYSHTDTRLTKEVNYYRLKMIDEEGKITYSKVITIIRNSKSILITSIVPNPVQHTASITIASTKTELAQLVIYDVSGKLIKQWQTVLAEGINIIPLLAERLHAGLYYLKVNGTIGNFSTQFIKQ